MTFKHINMVGFEVEGAWKVDRVRDRHENYFNGFHGDGSLSNIPQVSTNDRGWIGEYATPVPINNEEALIDTMEERWPDKWNHTCGFHIHISTKTINNYSKLMDQGFYRIFKRELEKELIPSIQNAEERERFQARLRGESTYCKRGWRAEVQSRLRDKSGDRYFHLNFCWSLHGTMEVRVPPMMNLSDGKRTMKWMTSFVETYLEKKRKIKAYKTEIEMTPLETENEKFESIIRNNEE